MFVTGSSMLARGTQLRVAIELVADSEVQWLESAAQVRWINDRCASAYDERVPAGMGLQFVDLDATARSLLCSVLYGNAEAGARPEGEADERLEAGDVVGSYRIHGIIGSGGMATVYLAEHMGLGRRVALKRLHRRLVDDRDSVRRFFEEGRLVNRVRHENVVEVYDIISEGDEKLYVMELLEGTPLSDVIKADNLPSLRRACAIAVQVCNALQAVHDAGVVHRDLKAENIVLIERSHTVDFVKLLDFGVAKSSIHTGSLLETVPGCVIGTPTHLAPEYIQTQVFDHRSDLYALGVLLYHLFTGALPFRATSFVDLLHSHVHITPPRPVEVRERELPAELDELILACLAKKADDRPQRASSVAATFGAVADRLGNPSLVWVHADQAPDTTTRTNREVAPTAGWEWWPVTAKLSRTFKIVAVVAAAIAMAAIVAQSFLGRHPKAVASQVIPTKQRVDPTPSDNADASPSKPTNEMPTGAALISEVENAGKGASADAIDGSSTTHKNTRKRLRRKPTRKTWERRKTLDPFAD